MKIYYVKDCSSCYHHIYVKGDGFCSEEGRYADGKDMPEWCPLEDATTRTTGGMRGIISEAP